MYVYIQRFYKYYDMMYEEQTENQQLTENGEDEIIPYWYIFKQTFPQLFNVFFVFFITLSLYPVVHSGIKYKYIFLINKSCIFITNVQMCF